MKLSALAAKYVAYKQSMGMRFHTEARTLRSFCRAMGDIALAEIEAGHVQAYIAGTGPVTRFWHRKHEVLRGFYRFAMARGYAASSPLPKIFQNHHTLCPTSFRLTNCRDCSTLPPVVRPRAASCSPTPVVCSSCCCTERECALAKRFHSD